MRTVRTKVYQFSELSKSAKDKAIECFRNNESFDYVYEEAFESVQKFAERFDIKMREFDFLETYRSKYQFEAEDCILELSGIRLRTYLLNNFYDLLYERKTYGEYKKRDNGKWKYDRYSNCQYEETCCPFTGVCYDEDLLQPIRNFIAKPNNDDFKDLLEDCLSTVSKTVRGEIEYQSEDEQIAETFIANEYEFTKEGNRF